MRAALLVVALAACGGSGPAPPPVGATHQACAESFCVLYPEGWEVEESAAFLDFGHPLSAEIVASVSLVDMSFIVESNQGSWPSSMENVERDFWAVQESGTPDTELEELVVEADGSVRSRGRVEGLVQWHRLVPTGRGPLAVAVTVRAPNLGWEKHARVFLDGVTVERG